MDDVRGLFLGMPHGTTPAAVTTNKNIIMLTPVLLYKSRVYVVLHYTDLFS